MTRVFIHSFLKGSGLLNETLQSYLDEISSWQQTMDTNLRKEDSWLSLVGLEWLEEGSNTIGSDPSNAIVLPEDAPSKLGHLDFSNGEVRISIESDADVTIDGAAVKSAVLRDDHNENGPSFIKTGSVTFSVIKRADEYGIRIRNAKSPAIAQFEGRSWFPVDSSYRVAARFFPYETSRTLQVVNSVGMVVPMQNPGYLEFELHGKTLRLEAFEAGENQWWLIFKDGTNGSSTYGAGRFLYVQHKANEQVWIDFNRAYNPPCAFTAYATCPLAPKENILSVEINAGEQF